MEGILEGHSMAWRNDVIFLPWNAPSKTLPDRSALLEQFEKSIPAAPMTNSAIWENKIYRLPKVQEWVTLTGNVTSTQWSTVTTSWPAQTSWKRPWTMSTLASHTSLLFRCREVSTKCDEIWFWMAYVRECRCRYLSIFLPLVSLRSNDIVTVECEDVVKVHRFWETGPRRCYFLEGGDVTAEGVRVMLFELLSQPRQRGK